MNDQDANNGTDARDADSDRWVMRADQDSPEARAGALLRQAVQREPIEAARLAVIRDRLRGDRRRPQRHWALRLAIALALMLSGGALTAAAQRYLHILAPPSGAQQPRENQPGFPAAPHVRRAPSPAPLPAPPPLEPEPPVETAVPSDVAVPPPRPRAAAVIAGPAPSVRLPESAGVAPPPLAPSETSSALAEESRLLGEALRRLRQNDDPRGALAILDEHDARFGKGALAPEATLARIEALLRMHRKSDALTLLDRITPSARGTGRELLISRAELRAAAGRCAASAGDFDALLRGDPPLDPITERAFWGRASCRAAADPASARSDLQDYLALFPDGRFAKDARAALAP